VALTPTAAALGFRIYGPDRREIDGDDFVGSGLTGRLTIKAPETGTYYVEVTGGSEFSTSEYELRSNRTVAASDGPPPVAGTTPPTDPDDDGQYEDVDGDGTVNVIDVAVLLRNLDAAVVQRNAAAFDFDGNGEVNIVDVATLLDLT